MQGDSLSVLAEVSGSTPTSHDVSREVKKMYIANVFIPKPLSFHMVLIDKIACESEDKLDLQTKVFVCIGRPCLTSSLQLPALVGLLAAQVLDLSLDTFSTLGVLRRKKNKTQGQS